MQDIANIFITFFVCVLVLLFFYRRPNKTKKAVADEPFYIPGFLEKPSTEKQLRRVSDITTQLLRDERNYNHSLKIMMKCKENIDLYQEKLVPINIRLSIKQTKQ